MSAANFTLIVVSFAIAGVLIYPKIRNAPRWRAMATPLASIIGSGFLVAGPILGHAAGAKAWLAMIALCGLAYVFGTAVRYNILHVEPILLRKPAKVVTVLERASQVSLSFAYFISVAYYINLLAAFGLRFAGVVDPYLIRIVATCVIGALGVLGAIGGLRALERVEVIAVGLKLSVIGGLLAALLVMSGIMAASGDFAWRAPSHPHGFEEFRIILGLLILVQGFETSRYLGDEYDAEMRVRTMRWAQLLSAGIYVAFILLITSLFKDGLPSEGGETAIIDIVAPIGAAVAPMIILAAIASQFSAAVADMNGAGGLISESANHKLPVKAGDLATAIIAIAIIWVADIYEIIAYASKAFVIYYGLQSLQAALAAKRQGKPWLVASFIACVALALIIFVLAAPAKV